MQMDHGLVACGKVEKKKRMRNRKREGGVEKCLIVSTLCRQIICSLAMGRRERLMKLRSKEGEKICPLIPTFVGRLCVCLLVFFVCLFAFLHVIESKTGGKKGGQRPETGF